MSNKLHVVPSENGRTFEFIILNSVGGVKKNIVKQVLFDPDHLIVGDKSFPVTNLALVDVLDDGSLSDKSRSGYGNTQAIISIVASCVNEFFKLYPDETVRFRGSDDEGLRTRLYRMLLSKKSNMSLLNKISTYMA